MKFILIALLLSSCAFVHRVQVGDIENKKGYVALPFDLKVSETGVDLGQAGSIIKSTSGNSNFGKNAKALSDIIGLFQMGPRTGNPVYNETYADNIIYGIYQKCPSGQVTGLTMIRETNSYPVVSGEIVRVSGICLLKKTSRIRKRNS